MLIALPNIDGTFACILFLPFEGSESFARLDTAEKAEAFFAERFPDAIPLMPQLKENYSSNPTGSMVTIKCSPGTWTERRCCSETRPTPSFRFSGKE